MHEHTEIEKYIRDWKSTFKQQTDHIKFIMGIPKTDTNDQVIREVDPSVTLKEKGTDSMDMLYPYYQTLEKYHPKSFYSDNFGSYIRDQKTKALV